MAKPTRQFEGQEGQYSIDIENAGPGTIAKDIDTLIRMFDPLVFHEDGEQGGISAENIQEKAIKENNLEDSTIDDNIESSFVNSGEISILLSLIAKAIKNLKGTLTWSENTKDNINNIDTRVKTNLDSINSIIQEISRHILSNDHDTKYFTKAQLNAGQLNNLYYTISQLNSGILNNLYHTRQELIPFLRGGDTNIKEEVYKIVTSDNGDSTFTYSNKDGTEIFTGQLTPEGYQVFNLREGNYQMGSNRIELTVGDTLRRSVASGGVMEISPTSIALTAPEGGGAEITIKYYERIGMAGEYIIKMHEVKPPLNDGKNMWVEIIK